MNLRPAAPPPKSARADDLESTAELPVLDPAGAATAAEDTHTDTDTWAPPLGARTVPAAPADSERVRELERNLQSMSLSLQSAAEQLHDTERLLVAKDERLRQVERARDEALQTLAATEKRTASLEQRAAVVAQELAQARARADAAAERAQQAEQRLEERDSDECAQRAREQEQQQVLVAQGRAHAAGMMEDLHHERARSMSYLETLQTLEGRRRI